MAEFMVLMKGDGRSTTGDWAGYIDKLRKTEHFRGGSSLGNGIAISDRTDAENCTVTGFMRFDAETIEEVRSLLDGNPLYDAGGNIEVLELIKD